ncbi:hypothetical protein PIB30_079963 [Stylosanthes scabra]|uniref:Uncharacterized protein n=1 Tax=Stylosanthes scabra TaxID=79078 RepID=A0ABU6ZQ18_9FABA|nr:hypothetical protein [Stylosanthes scabra]
MFAADTTSCFAAVFLYYASPSHAGLYRLGHDRVEVAALVVLLRSLVGAHTLAGGQILVGGGSHVHILVLLRFPLKGTPASLHNLYIVLGNPSFPFSLIPCAILTILSAIISYARTSSPFMMQWMRIALITGISDLLEDEMSE